MSDFEAQRADVENLGRIISSLVSDLQRLRSEFDDLKRDYTAHTHVITTATTTASTTATTGDGSATVTASTTVVIGTKQ